MEPFIAQIMMFGGNFAPRAWAMCDGQLMSINSNTALFSLLGTTFGGDGRTTFGLPDLRGRSAMHPGNGPGLSNYRWGQRGGVETNTLTVNNLAPHNHVAAFASQPSVAIPVNNSGGNEDDSDPSAGVMANVGGKETYTSDSANANYSGKAIATTGGSINVGSTGGATPVNNVQPFLCIYHVIALQGIFPSRN